MQDDIKSEFIINQSDTRFIRAGYSNIFFLIGLSFIILIYQALSELSAYASVKYITLIFTFIVFTKVYMASVSRIIFSHSKLILICAITKVEIPIDSISSYKLYLVPTSKTAILLIKIKGKLFPLFFYFVAPVTNHGPFDNTIKDLNSLLESRNK